MPRWLIAIAIIIICAAMGIMLGLYVRSDPEIVEQLEARGFYFEVPVPQIPDGARRPSKIVYLNREGARLWRGVDESSQNRTVLVPEGATEATIPAFAGTAKTWAAFAKCVREKLAPYDVEVVEQRPVAPGYMMVVAGGTTKDLGGIEGHHATGLAPFNSEPISNAIVLVFAAALKNQSLAMCETAGMEIGHAYGLDHARNCGDLMTYMTRCGARKFLDMDIVCGEHEARPCANKAKTQNAHQHLLKVLGPAVPAPK